MPTHRRIVSAYFLTLLLLLSSCGSTDGTDRAAAFSEQCATADYTAEVVVSAPRETETLHYTLAVEGTAERAEVTLLAPQTIAGIAAVVEGDSLALRYEGILLDAGTMAEEISAVNAVSLLLRAAANGNLLDCGTETVDERQLLRLCYTLTYGETEISAVFWLDGSNVPVCAEVEVQEEIVLFAEFTSFLFHDTMSAENAV